MREARLRSFLPDFAFGDLPAPGDPFHLERKSDRFGGQLYECQQRSVTLPGLSVESFGNRWARDGAGVHAS